MSQWLICEQGHLVAGADTPDVSAPRCSSCGQPLRVALPVEIVTGSTSEADYHSLDSTWDQTHRAPAETSFARTLGDYDLLAEIGRGGMGVVYRARQRAADRLVALKIIRPDRGQPDADGWATALARLQTEAQAAARLTHDHIVTVYDVGDVDGTPYYSMQLVEGPSLSALLRAGPLEPRRAARYLAAVAGGVAEAHRHGVLHRDLKPANILIDARLDRALVSDFGLAKIVRESADLTMAGQVFGSPPYMSPEQARDASQATVASDVYSLGATLYCALTGRPPFQATSVAETLRQVSESPPVPPRRLRPTIDRDLETICLKCLEKHAQQRYASAQALADDLERYLRHEPIAARRISRAARVARWCRRKPAAALAVGASVCLLVSVATLVLVGQLRESRARQQSQYLTSQADTGFREALAAYDKLVFEVQEKLGDAPGTRQTRQALLATALGGMNKVLAEHSDATARLRGATLIRMGDIAYEIGQTDAAHQHFRQAREILQRQLLQSPADAQAQRDLSVACEKLGLLQLRAGDTAAAREHFLRCYQLRSQLEQASLQGQRDMAMAHYNLGRLEFAAANWQPAADQLRLAIQWIQRAEQASGPLPQVRHDLALYLSALGDTEQRRGNLAASQRAYQESVAAVEALAAAPEQAAARETYASSLRLLGDVQRAAGDWNEAQASYRRAQSTAKSLQASDPEAVNVQWLLAITTQRVGLAEHHLSQGASLDSLRQGIELLTPLAARAPGDTVKVLELAHTHQLLAQTLLTQSPRTTADMDSAHAHQLAAQDLRAQLALARGDNPNERLEAGRGYVVIAATAEAESRYLHALAGYQRAWDYFHRTDNQQLLAGEAEFTELLEELPQAIAIVQSHAAESNGH